MNVVFPENVPVPSFPSSTKSSLTEQLIRLSTLFSPDFFKELNTTQTDLTKVTAQIKDLTKEVNATSQKIDQSKTQIGELEGGKLSRFFLIGGLIKALFQWYNRKNLCLEKKQVDDLYATINRLKKDITTLSNQEKDLSLAKERHTSGMKFDQFKDQETFTSEELALIFDVESKVRQILKIDTHQESEFQEVFNQTILPLVTQAKQFVSHRPFHFSVQAAAAKGKAAQAGFRAIQTLTQQNPVLEIKKISNQEVFLLPAQEAVFKRSSERANEEERIVNDLFDLMAEQAIVPTFNIQRAALERFEIQIDSRVEQRSFSLNELTFGLRYSICKKLAMDDLDLVVKDGEARKVDPGLQNYQKMARLNWKLQLLGKEWEIVTLKELQKFYLTNNLPHSAKIGTSEKEAQSLEEHIRQGTPFFQALDYFPTLQSPSGILLTPHLSNPDTKNSYELCEQFQWTYKDGNGQENRVNFKTLHALFLQGQQMTNINPISSSSQLKVPTSFDRVQAFNAPWKVITPELMESRAGLLSPFANVQAKPFIGEMHLFKDIMHYPKAYQSILQKLTPDAEFQAILTGELQLLDLHSGNLGVAPQTTEEYERFKDLKFTTKNHLDESFKQLLLNYLNGTIKGSTVINFEENGIKMSKPLKDLPELQKALDVPWQFVIFDTDLSLTEDNYLQIQTRRNKQEHLIPVRSVLLQTTWKNQPLNDQTIQHLLNSSDRDLRVENWVKRKDAPIRKRLSPEVQAQLDRDLKPLIEHYTLSEPRLNYNETTLKQLREDFTKELSDISKPNHLKIWKMLEEDLSQKLSSSDLTSASLEATERRKQIATQLFPRLTLRQQEALFERQERRKNYLSSYQELKNSDLHGEALHNQMEQFLEKPETPLTSLRKERLLMTLRNRDFKDSKELQLQFKETLCKECQPTYFNLMKAMYPLLAEAYDLNAAIYADEEYAGEAIGLYIEPLETVIHAGKMKISSSDACRLAKHLEEEMKKVQHPAFFGHW